MRFRRIFLGAGLVVFGAPLALLAAVVVAVGIFDRSNGTLVSSGVAREFLLHVPPSYDPARPAPLVVSFHAGATWPAHQANLSRWNRLADQHGFLVVYPAGVGEIGGLDLPRIWPVEREADRARDVRFVAELLDALAATYALDPARIYADGMSQGGAMAFALSCELPERIAAVGTVAAAQSRPAAQCADAPPVPAIAFHGTADRLVPYLGGPLGDPFAPVRPVYPPVREFLAEWARRNRCTGEPVETPVAPAVTRLAYTACAGGADVRLYTIAGAGHVWPGGKPLPEWRVGRNSAAVDATALIWAFFQEHPRRDGQAADGSGSFDSAGRSSRCCSLFPRSCRPDPRPVAQPARRPRRRPAVAG